MSIVHHCVCGDDCLVGETTSSQVRVRPSLRRLPSRVLRTRADRTGRWWVPRPSCQRQGRTVWNVVRLGGIWWPGRG